MQLEITSSSPIIDRKFGNWIIKHIQALISSEVESVKLKTWDKYFNEQFSTLYGKEISSKDIIKIGVRNLVCMYANSAIIIRISPNIFMPGLDRVKVESLCKLINYGNTTISAVPIFTNAFDHVADNIDEYVEMYMNER